MLTVAFCKLFFQDDSESLERLEALCRPSSQPDEDRIVAYLEADLDFVGIGVIDCDRITGDDLRGSCLRSDGVWIWPGVLAHYVRRYHLRIPEDFVRSMAARNWLPPGRGEVDFDAINEERYTRE